MNRIPSASKVGVRVTPYPKASKRKSEGNQRGRVANEPSTIGQLDTPNTTRVIRLFTKELSPLADHQLTDEEASFSDDSCNSALFPILDDECLSSVVSSEVDEFSLDFAADFSSFDEDADDYLPSSQLSQKPVSLSPSTIDDDRIPSSLPLENTSEITRKNFQTLNLVEMSRGVVSADGQWVIDPEPTNDASHRYEYKLKNIGSANSVEFLVEFDSSPSKELTSNLVFLTRNGKEWFVYVGEKSIYLYLLKNSNTIERKLKYKIENTTALTISPDGEYFAVAGSCDKERAVFIWQIAALSNADSPEKILSKLKEFRIKNISFSPDRKLVAVAGVEGINKHIIYILSVESEKIRSAFIGRAAPIDLMIFEQASENYALRIKYSDKANQSRRILAQDSLAEEDFSLSQINNLG